MKNRRNQIQICLLCTAMLQAFISGAQPVTQIAAGYYDSLFLKSDGSLWGMGYNLHGELGDGTFNNTTRPEQIVSSNVTAIAAGGSHSLFLKSDGSLWAMGAEFNGELGDGISGTIGPGNVPPMTNRPEQIVSGGVVAIAAGVAHSLFLKSDGSLWSMGNNFFGQRGDGTQNDTNRPQQIVASNVTAIAAGQYHSLFLKSDGSLWGMGANDSGQLGDGTFNDTNRPEQIVSSGVLAIAAGREHSLFLESGGSLWGMGYNYEGALGNGTNNNVNLPEQIVASNVTAIAAGGTHSLFLMSNGSLWAMGSEEYGQLGDGTYGMGPYPYNGTNRPEQIVASGVTAIAGGYLHSLFLKSDGSLWAMGYNNVGQLGDGTTNSINSPEQVVPSNRISIRLSSDGKVSLSFEGLAGTNYVLDRTFSLSPPINWIPQLTNPAGSFGPLVFTNAPVPATNNFWRIRSVP